MFKKILKIIGAVLTVIGCTVAICFLRRNSDGQGSTGIDERDSRITDGITECEERTERIEEGITRAEDGIGRCEEHLRRAEEILQEAINKKRS